MSIGVILFFGNWWLLNIGYTMTYIITLISGYLCLLSSGLWVSRILNSKLMTDVFNIENESFMQETKLIENEYSVNLSTKFQYKNKGHNG